MAVKTYNPAEVKIICGPAIIEGYVDGSFITVDQLQDRYELNHGADGEASRTRLNNRGATVTLTLKQTSDSNDVFSAYVAADDLNDSGVFPILIKEAENGRTVISGESAWVRALPTVDFAKTIGERAWTIDIAQANMFVGGNT